MGYQWRGPGSSNASETNTGQYISTKSKLHIRLGVRKRLEGGRHTDIMKYTSNFQRAEFTKLKTRV